MSKRITARMLLERDACESQIKKFKEKWPQGVIPGFKIVLEALQEGFDIDWFAENFLSEESYKIYEDAIAPAYKVYQDAIMSAYKLYLEALSPALKIYQEATAIPLKIYYGGPWSQASSKVYQEAIAPAYKVYQEATEGADKVYLEALAPALKVYHETIASALFEAWKIDNP